MKLAEEIIRAATARAEVMTEGSKDFNCKLTLLPVSQMLMITYQEEKRGKSWWVRYVGIDGAPIKSLYCEHIIQVMAAVAEILEEAGVE